MDRPPDTRHLDLNLGKPLRVQRPVESGTHFAACAYDIVASSVALGLGYVEFSVTIGRNVGGAVKQGHGCQSAVP